MCTSTLRMCFSGVDRDSFSLCYRSIVGVSVMNGRREGGDRVLQSLVSAFTYTLIERLDL